MNFVDVILNFIMLVRPKIIIDYVVWLFISTYIIFLRQSLKCVSKLLLQYLKL